MIKAWFSSGLISRLLRTGQTTEFVTTHGANDLSGYNAVDEVGKLIVFSPPFDKLRNQGAIL